MKERGEPQNTTIMQLTIERFRGLRSLVWLPDPRVNIILGGGDAGKTSILEAIALLLNPSPNYALMDTDYWERDVEKEFLIEAVVTLADWVPISQQKKMHWPWHWAGNELQAAASENSSAGQTVYCFRVRGTAELELMYEVVQPDGEAENFSASLRRTIGLVRLSGDERNDRDLRLVQGSALDRMLDDKGFRSRAAHKLAAEPVNELLSDKAKESLELIGATFEKKSLPSPVGLGITGSGLSLNALIGLTAPKGETTLPLISWGAGTRRLASLTIAGALHEKAPITLVDELERGLECYRQRTLIRALRDGNSQVFVTTHSAAALRAAEKCSFWYLDTSGKVGILSGHPLMRQLVKDPEAFLSRFTVVAEGITEVGFTSALLERDLSLPLADYGIHVTDAGSNETAIDLLQALSLAGLSFGGMADNEGTNPERWAKAKAALGTKLCRWEKGCLEEEVIAGIEDGQLEAFIQDPNDELTGWRLRTLSDRLGIEDKSFVVIAVTAKANLRKLIVEACCGTVPEDKKGAEKSVKKTLKSHSQSWFKSDAGGRELAGKVLALGQWPNLRDRLLPFLNAVRAGAGLPPIADITQ